MSGAMHLSFIQLAQNTTAYRHAYDRVLYALVYITAHFFFFFALTLGFGFLLSTRIGELHMSTRDVVEATPPTRYRHITRTPARNGARPNYVYRIPNQRERLAALKPAIRTASLGVAHTWLFVEYVNRGELPTPRPIHLPYNTLRNGD